MFVVVIAYCFKDVFGQKNFYLYIPDSDGNWKENIKFPDEDSFNEAIKKENLEEKAISNVIPTLLPEKIKETIRGGTILKYYIKSN